MRRSTTSTSSTGGRWPSSSRSRRSRKGQELELKLVEVGLYDPEAGVGKLNGLDVAVAGAAKLVGKKVRVRVERVLDGTAFATLAGAPEQAVAADHRRGPRREADQGVPLTKGRRGARG